MNARKFEIIISGSVLKIASLEDEWDKDLEDPETILEQVRNDKNNGTDIFTFWQRLPHVSPKYRYYLEWDNIAALEYMSYGYWFDKILDAKSRNMVRKAEKRGIVTSLADYDDTFVQGIVEIYNESPIRQGRRFKHFGKTYDEAKKANATHIERSDFIGAYYDSELVGFIKLVYGDRTARTEQIISKLKYRDKAPTNALIARAIQVCELRRVPYLVYGRWPRGTLAEFKRSNGFMQYDIPRYYVPLTAWGMIALRLRLHRGIKQLIPGAIKGRLIGLRTKLNVVKKNH